MRKIKIISLMAALLLSVTISCEKKEIEPQISNVRFTPCQQSKLRSNELADKVDVEFTDKGVQIAHYDFEVTCDFTTVNVTHTFVNGVLNITQQGSPNQANCVCYTDVSYTIGEILQNEVNVIFINGVQVYCYNENNTLQGTKWKLIEVLIAKDYQQHETLDYSEKNIIYEFQNNNKLVITGNMDDLFIFDDFRKGEYFYEYNEPNVCPTCLPGLNLTISSLESEQEEGRYYCLVNLDNKTMRISGDGKIIEGVYYGWNKFFIKLN